MNMVTTAAAVLVLGGGLSLCDLCGGTPAVAQVAPSRVAPAESKTVTFKVAGMTCGGCVIGVRTVLTRLTGVSKADVSYEHTRAVITYDPARVTVEQMIAAIKTLGYTATVAESPVATT